MMKVKPKRTRVIGELKPWSIRKSRNWWLKLYRLKIDLAWLDLEMKVRYELPANLNLIP
jgi:hypothetical protein